MCTKVQWLRTNTVALRTKESEVRTKLKTPLHLRYSTRQATFSLNVSKKLQALHTIYSITCSDYECFSLSAVQDIALTDTIDNSHLVLVCGCRDILWLWYEYVYVGV